MFDYAVAKVVGSYAAAMNGVDAIIFTAGVGENAPTTRAGISSYLGYLGAELDEEANAKRGEDRCISKAAARSSSGSSPRTRSSSLPATPATS